MNSTLTFDTAIIFASWHDDSNNSVNSSESPVCEPLLCRPMIQLTVERIVRQGCLNLHIVLGDHSLQIQDLLGDGERWGCQITYHYVRQNDRFCDFMTRLRIDPDQHHLVVDANMLVPVEWQCPLSKFNITPDGLACCWQDSELLQWSGWAILRGGWSLNCTADCSREQLEIELMSDMNIARCVSCEPICVREFSDLLQASLKAMNEAEIFGLSGNLPEAPETGLWISQDCIIHDEVTLIPPLFLGPGVRVEKGASLGPNLIVGKRSYIDYGAKITESKVLPDSYVGEHTELLQVVIKGAHCYQVPDQIVIKIDDPGIISPIQSSRWAKNNWTHSRLAIQLLRMILAPLYWMLRVWQRDLLSHNAFLSMPDNAGSYGSIVLKGVAMPDMNYREPGALLRHFLLTFYPGLSEVLRGRLMLIGPRMRSPEEVSRLPYAWRSIYHESRCGLLQETMLEDCAESYENTTRYIADKLAGNVAECARGMLKRYLFALLRDVYIESKSELAKKILCIKQDIRAKLSSII